MMATFGDRLRELRRERGMQQRELGDLYNLSSSAIGSYERNLREPTLDLLLKLSEFFGVSVDYLLCRTEERLTAVDYKEKDSFDLTEFLTNHVLTVGGVEVTEADKRRICDMATGLFWTRITGEDRGQIRFLPDDD